MKNIVALSSSLMLLAAAAGTASANYRVNSDDYSTNFGGNEDGDLPGPADTWAATHPSFGHAMGHYTTHVMRRHKTTPHAHHPEG